MAENLTTYTEVDPSLHITVDSATKASVASLVITEAAYLYKDKGVAFYDNNFEINFDFYLNSASALGAQIGLSSLSTGIGTVNEVDNASGSILYSLVYKGAGGFDIYLVEIDSGTAYAINIGEGILSANTIYYAKFKRDESIGAYGRVYFDVYGSSANRSSQTSPISNLFLDLHTSKKDFRYIYALQGKGEPTGTYDFTGYIENLDDIGTKYISITDTTVATDSVSLTVYSTITDSIVLNEAILLNGATYQFITDTVVAVDGALTSYKEVHILDTVTGVDIAGSINQNSLMFGVTGFPSGQPVEYRIKNQQGVVIKNWTSVGVAEDEEITGYSTYTITNVILDNGFQGKVSWRINGTNYYAVEILNFFESFVFGQISVGDIEASTILAKEATVASRLAAADYTAPDNAGIAALLTDTALLIAFIKNKKYLEKTGATWYLVIRNADDSADILRKAIKGTDGTTEITDITAAAMGMEIKSTV